MQHSAHVWQSYANHVAPLASPRDDLLAFPRMSLRYLGLPEEAVPANSEALDMQVARAIESVSDMPDMVARVEEIRRNATIVRAYVFASLDKRSAGWATTSLDEDETNYTTLEAKKEELERALTKRSWCDSDSDVMAKRLKEVTKKRDETKARYIASLSKEIMAIARGALGRVSPATVTSESDTGDSSVLPSPAHSSVFSTRDGVSPGSETTQGVIESPLHRISSTNYMASCFDEEDATHATAAAVSSDACADDCEGIDALDLANALELGDLLSEQDLCHFDNDHEHLSNALVAPAAPPQRTIDAVDLKMFAAVKMEAAQNTLTPPTRPHGSWCSWPQENHALPMMQPAPIQ